MSNTEDASCALATMLQHFQDGENFDRVFSKHFIDVPTRAILSSPLPHHLQAKDERSVKSFLPLAIEALSLILLFFFGHLIEAHTKVSKSRIGLPLKIVIYPIVIFIASYFVFNEINSLTSALFDYDLREKICTIDKSCESTEMNAQKNDKLIPAEPARNTINSMREICKLALDPDLQHWATLPEFSKSVAHAQTRVETH